MTNKEQEKHDFCLHNETIAKIIKPDCKVLDLGCGSGELLHLLKNTKNISGRGVDINQDNVIKCIEKGLSIIQGDIDEGLKEYPDKSYDYVILSQTLQSTNRPDYVIKEMLRVGKRVVISFPNFAYWKIRFRLALTGRMPRSKVLPFEWYDTPNIHLLTIKDFKKYCKDEDIKLLDQICITKSKIQTKPCCKLFSNLLGEEVVFVVSEK